MSYPRVSIYFRVDPTHFKGDTWPLSRAAAAAFLYKVKGSWNGFFFFFWKQWKVMDDSRNQPPLDLFLKNYALILAGTFLSCLQRPHSSWFLFGGTFIEWLDCKNLSFSLVFF
ncbi:hypothetical protein V8G54_026523, partial [Vigna mungo]